MPDETKDAKSQKTLAPAKRGRKPGPVSKKFKATKFDKDLVKLIQSGVVRFTDWCQALGVDETQARARVNVLVEKGYLASDAQLVGVYRLGIEGYNKYGSMKKPALVAPLVPARLEFSAPSAFERAPTKPVASERKEKPIASPSSFSDAPVLLARTPPASVGPRRFDDSGALTEEIPKARNELDLAEMIQRGSPSNTRKVDSERCELCRGDFKYSIKEPKLAKFAHCTCGSAYHEDCYDSLVDSGNGCARCGRKLTSVLDQSSQDSLKDIKDAFE
ncbi:hypothetical protein HY994_01220 [Candidatus Micrarchaeota archaeon]|nr:hypothetical protein [Candidatus Micrarchaeota archaeon]